MGTKPDNDLISYLVEQTYLDLHRPKALCSYHKEKMCFELSFHGKKIEIPENWGLGHQLKFLKNGYEIYLSSQEDSDFLCAVLSKYFNLTDEILILRKVWPGFSCFTKNQAELENDWGMAA